MKSARGSCITLCGDSQIGETAPFLKLHLDPFSAAYEPTIITDHFTYANADLRRPEVLELNFWDTGGDEQNRRYLQIYLRRVDVALLTANVVNPQALTCINSWFTFTRTANPGCLEPSLVLVRTKSDEIAVSLEERESFQSILQQSQCVGFIVSTKTGDGIPEMSAKLYDVCSERKRNPPKAIPDEVQADYANRSRCP